MKNLSLLLVFVLLATSACTFMKVESEDVTSAYHLPRASTEGIVYLEKIDRPHEIIAYVTVQTQRIQPVERVLEQMKKEAAQLGGDALTDLQIDATGIWKKLPAQKLLGNAYIDANFKAAVVIFSLDSQS